MTEVEAVLSEGTREQFTIIIDKDFLFPNGMAEYNWRVQRHGEYWTEGNFRAKADENHIELLHKVLFDLERKVNDASNGVGY